MAWCARTVMLCGLLGAAMLARAPVFARNEQVNRIPSKDGTPIAVECAGAGPTLLMVHGGTGDRKRWTPMFPLLSDRFTVCAMDRRGRGDSGDAPDYHLLKEAEDVAAVVESLKAPVYVLGHSYGGVAALEAAFLTGRIAKLILYEPPVNDPVARNLAVGDRMEQLIAKGQREEATVAFLSDVVGVSPPELAAMRARPNWPQLVATIDQQIRQIRALATYTFNAKRVGSIGQPTLLLMGSETASPYLRQAIESLRTALPDVTVVTLKGQQHNAMDTARDLLANTIAEFLAR